jgi:O-acetyl-ADP-ribose deacetylase (regulator of RNase III)
VSMRVLKELEKGRITVAVGDITTVAVDAVVNAANSGLLGGGGVDGAIHRAAGPELLAACRRLRSGAYPDGLPTGQAVITEGYRLPARYVIHTVGPVWRAGSADNATLLAACYRNSLQTAQQAGCVTVAFPAVSTGVYGYPREEAAPVVWRTVRTALADFTSITKVYLVFFAEADARVFLQAIGQ